MSNTFNLYIYFKPKRSLLYFKHLSSFLSKIKFVDKHTYIFLQVLVWFMVQTCEAMPCSNILIDDWLSGTNYPVWLSDLWKLFQHCDYMIRNYKLRHSITYLELIDFVETRVDIRIIIGNQWLGVCNYHVLFNLISIGCYSWKV